MRRLEAILRDPGRHLDDVLGGPGGGGKGGCSPAMLPADCRPTPIMLAMQEASPAKVRGEGGGGRGIAHTGQVHTQEDMYWPGAVSSAGVHT